MVPANLTRGARRSSSACLDWGIRPPYYAIASHAGADYERVAAFLREKTFVLHSLWQETIPAPPFRPEITISGKHLAITAVTLPRAPATVSCGLMAFNALLMCREEKHLRVLGKALDEVSMEQEVCLSAPEALDLTVQRHYSALVIDFDLPGAAIVARMARLAPSRRRPVIFGMIGALTEIAETFQAGANFIFYKPLGVEQMVRCLRAGRGFMRPDRRNSPRQSLESLVYLQFGIASLPAMVLDLNQNGLALQAPEPLPPVQQVPLRFVLPGTSQHGGRHGRGHLGRRWRTRRHALLPPDAGFAKIFETVVWQARGQEEDSVTPQVRPRELAAQLQVPPNPSLFSIPSPLLCHPERSLEGPCVSLSVKSGAKVRRDVPTALQNPEQTQGLSTPLERVLRRAQSPSLRFKMTGESSLGP